MNEAPSVGLSGSLRTAGFKLGRLQTGTPARLHKDSIDFSKLEIQHGEVEPVPFSYMNHIVDNAVCWSQSLVVSLPHTLPEESGLML